MQIETISINMTKSIITNAFITLFSCVCLLESLNVAAEIKILSNGDKISWDGSYYDFRDSAGIQMIKMWIPPDIKTIKGVLISGHGGSGGDSRNFARDENIRAFAMRLGFAVAGLHNFPGRRAYESGAQVFFYALNEFAKIGTHPEIANLPFVMYGSSNGGAATYGFVNYAPERAICFVANVSAGGNPTTPVEGALKVPGIFIMGKFDALMGERGITRTEELLRNARPKGALWCWAMELKGHEDGASFDIYMKLVEQAVAARYPENGDPSKGPVILKELQEESGWLVDFSTWDSGLTYVASYKDYKGDRQTAGWVLNKDIAYVYRSLATHHNPLVVKVKEFDRTYNPNTDPGTMFSLGGPVTNPGEQITITCDMENFPEWKTIEFFNGSVKIGEVNSGNNVSITTQLDPKSLVYCLTVLATANVGNQRTCTPMHFFVSDPSLKWDKKGPQPVYADLKTNAWSKNAGKNIKSQSPDPDDSVLVAYGLTPEMERQFSADDNKVSEFWMLLDESKDCVRITARRNATGSANFNGVLSHDCNMDVKAAYGADGIYLLFEINDDNDVAWPNKFVGTENEQFYLNFDAVDVIMDSRSINNICDPENMDMFITKSFGLTSTTKQYQIACGTEKDRPSGFHRTKPDPWDMFPVYFTFSDARAQLGLQIENIKTDYYYKAQEWFIPWSEYGKGFPGEPDAGTRFGFTCGFNDRDEGEHFPPGVTTSGGTVPASNSIRWIGKSDPWGSGPSGGKPPYGWGEIEIGPMMK
jgi:hypothetical protein